MSTCAAALVAVLQLAVTGQAAPPPAAPPSPISAAAEAARKAVEASELAFAAAVRDHDVARFASFLDEGAVFVSGSEVTRGKAAVLEAWAGLLAAYAPYFEWHPEIVELSADGTLGLSRGPWTMRGKGKDGQPVERTGLFNSVWRQGADGAWKIIFDAGCPPCAAPK